MPLLILIKYNQNRYQSINRIGKSEFIFSGKIFRFPFFGHIIPLIFVILN